jgi:hypothetical protein
VRESERVRQWESESEKVRKRDSGRESKRDLRVLIVIEQLRRRAAELSIYIVVLRPRLLLRFFVPE